MDICCALRFSKKQPDDDIQIQGTQDGAIRRVQPRQNPPLSPLAAEPEWRSSKTPSIATNPSRIPKNLIINVLPYDLKVEICKHLNFFDVLRLRQVCRNLFQVSKERPVWLHFLNQQSTQLPAPDRVFLDKKIERHSSKELEEAFLNPKRRTMSKKTRYTPTSRRVVCRSTSRAMTFVPQKDGDEPRQLLPGGRWLIAVKNKERDIICHDLWSDDDPTREPFVVLIPGWDILGPRILFDVDIDTTSPYLVFNIAVALVSPSPEGLHRVEVWRVSPVFDEATGSVQTLESRMLSSVVVPDLWNLRPPIQLCGSFIQYCIAKPGLFRTYVLEWDAAVGSRRDPFVVAQSQSLYLCSLIKLPSFSSIDTLLLSVTELTISLRSLRTNGVSYAADEVVNTSFFFWEGTLPARILFGLGRVGIHRPLFKNGSLHILMFGFKLTLGLSIPLSAQSPCTIGTPKVYNVAQCSMQEGGCYPEGSYHPSLSSVQSNVWSTHHEHYQYISNNLKTKKVWVSVGVYRTSWDWEEGGCAGEDDQTDTPRVSCIHKFFVLDPSGNKEFSPHGDGTIMSDQYSHRLVHRPSGDGFGFVVYDYDTT